MKVFLFLLLATCALAQDEDSGPIGEEPCTSDDGAAGLCVPYYLCGDDNKIIQDGAGIITPRFGEECTRDTYLCCGTDEISKTPVIPSTERPVPKRTEGCGVRNTNGVGIRIVNDKIEQSQYGEFPWMIALLRDEKAAANTIKVYKCGGALIHPKIVVTAAHCVTNNSKPLSGLTARAGEWDTQITTEKIPHQDRKIVKIVAHEHYNPGNLFNDIAILVLEKPFDIKETIDLVCLHEQAKYVDPARCFVTGWGKNEFGKEGRYQVILKLLELPIVDKNTCQAALRKTRLGPRFILHSSFICAGGEAGKDTCTGDGGSPLVCPIPGQKGRYQLSGMVAWGIGCGEKQVPGVYTNMAQFKDWIEDQCVLNDVNDLNQVNIYARGA